jgi:DNA mismatch repair protein MutS
MLSMVFQSILFVRAEDNLKTEAIDVPPFFPDLNLDQVIEAIVAGKEEYNLKPFFYTALGDIDAIKYRHAIMQDLENETLFEIIKSFSENMRTMRTHLALADSLYYKYQKERMFLEAIAIYGAAVNRLVQDLSRVDLKSAGFAAFRDYLTNYAASGPFKSLQAATNQLLEDLLSVKYCLLIKGNSIIVRKYESEIDYSAEVEHTFEKFKQGAAKDYRAEYADSLNMNHVEAGVLELVAQLYPDIFSSLDSYCQNNANYLDETLGAFDREIQFYVAYLEYVAGFRSAGLQFCYPQLSKESKEVFNEEGFDVALAHKLINEKAPVVCNDFYLKDRERIFVVTGPNQGGKTTFARTFGQLHYMASLGCPVPGKAAQFLLCDRLLTHFEKEENLNNLRGKLQDDLVRIFAILNQATPNSIILMNEIFTSTTLKDAVFLGKKVMAEIIQLDSLGVFVTFLDELASISEKTVSLVSTVVPENPAVRTYKIVRRPADGLAYALSIAEKYRLTYDYLQERLKS